MPATSVLVCIANVSTGASVDAQRGRESEWKRVRADAASICAERPDTGKRFAHILYARKGIPPGSREIGWRALRQVPPAQGRATEHQDRIDHQLRRDLKTALCDRHQLEHDSVHQPQFQERKERSTRANRQLSGESVLNFDPPSCWVDHVESHNGDDEG